MRGCQQRWRHNRSRGAMGQAVVAAALCMLVMGCTGASGSSSRPTPTAAPTVRFRADWSQGLSGWQATPGWTVVDGALESSTSVGIALTIPYQPPAGAYSVELDVQVITVPQRGGYVILDVPASPSADGYQAGVTGLRVPGPRRNGDHPTARTTITPIGDQDATSNERAEADYEPGDGVRTYRIAVDGSAVLLYVDGRFLVAAASTKSGPLAGGPLVLKVGGAHVRISGLRVIA